jgi:hypothetical protein
MKARWPPSNLAYRVNQLLHLSAPGLQLPDSIMQPDPIELSDRRAQRAARAE